MSRKHLIILVLIFIIASALFSIAIYSTFNRDCETISDQNMRDDCYHALAHATGDRAICSKIAESQEKEHCLGHIPV